MTNLPFILLIICAFSAGYTVYSHLYHTADFSLNHPPASTCFSFLLLDAVTAALALLCIMYITYLIYMCVCWALFFMLLQEF